MKAKKLITVGIALAISLGAVGCTKKATPEDTTVPKNGTTNQANTPVAKDYTEHYSTKYEEYLGGLSNYNMYNNTESINKYYTENEYPGNEKYVSDLKAAYKDSRDKIQSFITSLKDDVKTEDADLKKMNENIIAEGQKTIDDLDARIKKLDELPKDIMNKSQNEFIKAVDEATRIKDKTENGFNKMLEDMNKALGFTPKTTTNNTTTNNTNTKK